MVKPVLILAQEGGGEEPGWWQSILQTFFQWVLDYFCTIMKPLIEFALNQLPDAWTNSLGDQIETVSYWFGIIDYWVPLDWAFSALMIFISWRIGFIIALLIMKIVRGA